mgnify:CR=1 FL=1
MADNLETQAGSGGPFLATDEIPGASEGAAPEPTGPTPAGRGSNLRDIWEFREKPFAVRVKGKRKAYKTARQAATAVKEALRSAPAEAVSVELEGQPVTLPALEFAPFRDVLARLMVLEQRREQAAENHRKAQAAERERIRRAQEADDEEALVLLLRAWRL